jgi:hypothetical protein
MAQVFKHKHQDLRSNLKTAKNKKRPHISLVRGPISQTDEFPCSTQCLAHVGSQYIIAE